MTERSAPEYLRNVIRIVTQEGCTWVPLFAEDHGHAINPARDFGPRIAHASLPLGKTGSGWNYALVPVVGPFIGAALAGLFVRIAHF